MWESDEGKNVSYWQASEQTAKAQPLTAQIDTDVCVIGGGIAGLTTAYLLANAGKKVAVIDDGTIGGGETARTTAHLSWAIDDRLYRLIKWHGEDKARLAVQSHMAAVDEIERIVRAENIDCDFRRLDGYLVEADGGSDDLDEEFEATQRLGFTNVRMADKISHGGSDGGVRALRFPDQGQFHILKYLSALARAIESRGGRLFSSTHATEWTTDGSPQVTTDGGHQIAAKSIVLATNYPIQSKMFAKLPAYRTYVIGARVAKEAVEPMLWWDTLDPYHYVRTQPEDGYDVLIAGGEDHRTGQENDGDARFEKLWEWTKQRFPAEELMYKWSGQVFETHDGLAFIGRFSSSEPDVYLITGDSGMGMTHGTIGGMLVSDLILGRENQWADVYEPSRILTQSITESVSEVISSTKPYVEWVTGGDVSSVDEIKNGEGAVVRSGLSKIAAYRDDDGKLHQHSAVCTHMGCIVQFNSTEKTWDCPCHGSRFGIDGHVINTPAISPLGPVEEGS